MPILNYTTKIDAVKTIGEIQQVLVKHGARKVMQDYDEKQHPIALFFMIETVEGPKYIRLTADAASVQRVLKAEGVKCDIEQAERVAWRIQKDLVEAQMAMLQAQMAGMQKLFFSDLLDETGEKTLFEIYQEKQKMRLPAGGTT
jgi:hypothetical protein